MAVYDIVVAVDSDSHFPTIVQDTLVDDIGPTIIANGMAVSGDPMPDSQAGARGTSPLTAHEDHSHPYDRPMWKGTLAGGAAIVAGDYISWTEQIDTDNMGATGTTPVTCLKDGIYRIEGSAKCAGSAPGDVTMIIHINDEIAYLSPNAVTTSSAFGGPSFHWIKRLNAGDTIRTKLNIDMTVQDDTIFGPDVENSYLFVEFLRP